MNIFHDTYYFINVVTFKHLDDLLSLCKELEEKFNTDILTGINYIETVDGKYMIGFTFRNSKEAFNHSLQLLKKKHIFDNIYTYEENWSTLLPLAKIAIIGNFSYKMLAGRR